jgi:hypothetical protein
MRHILDRHPMRNVMNNNVSVLVPSRCPYIDLPFL